MSVYLASLYAMSFTYSPYDMSSEQLEHLTYEKSSPSSAILSHFGHFIFTSYIMTIRPISLLKEPGNDQVEQMRYYLI
jgi:hypothetical protein